MTPPTPVNTAAREGRIGLTFDGSVATAVLDWPQRRNAMSRAMWISLADAIDTAADREARLIIIRGAGDVAFAAGADIRELADCLGDIDAGRAYMQAADIATDRIEACPVPVIAAIRGFCIGAGLEIALACDFRLATQDSEFGAPPARLGANYSLQSTGRLVDLVGPGQARRMLFTGDRLSATRAAEIGLVETLCSGQEFETELSTLSDTLCRNSPYSIRTAKVTLRALKEEALAMQARQQREEGFLHADLREGITSFLQKRPASFGAGRN